MSADGKHLFAVARTGGDPYVYSYDVDSDGALTLRDSIFLHTTQTVESIAITPDGEHLYVGLGLESGCLAGAHPRCLAPSGEAESQAARRGQPARGDVAAVDIAADGTLTLDQNFKVSVTADPGTLAVTPDGKTLIVAGSSGAAESYVVGADGDLNWTAGPVALPDVDAVTSQVTPNGEFAYLGGADGSVATLRVQKDGGIGLIDLVEPPAGIDATFRAFAMAPDGKGMWAGGGIDLSGSGMDYSLSWGPLRDDGSIGTTTLTPGPIDGPPTGVGAAPGGTYAYAWGGDPASSLAGFYVGSESIESVAGSPYAPTVGTDPAGLSGPGQTLAITPNQGPKARFGAIRHATLGAESVNRQVSPTVTFDASASTDPDGQVIKYRWDFGDGHKRTTTDPEIDHTYRGDGRHKVKLRVTDDEGCSSKRVFTGQIALCNGSRAAVRTTRIRTGSATVKRPRVKARSLQRQRGKRIAVKLRAGAAEPVKVAARGKVKIKGVKRAFKTTKAAKRAEAGRLAKLTLRVKGKRAARLLKNRHKGVAKVTVKITNSAGGKAMLRRNVKLKR